MNRALIVAEGRGGPPHRVLPIRAARSVPRDLIAGDLAHMTLAAFRAGADEILAVRANRAVAATLTFRDVTLEARNPGQAGNATLVHRTRDAGGRHSLIIRNVVAGLYEEHRGLANARELIDSVNAGRILHARGAPPGDSILALAPDGAFLSGGSEGPDVTLDDWRDALAGAASHDEPPAAMAVGTSRADVLAAAEETAGRLGVPLYAGAGYHQTKGELKAATLTLARAASTARIVCNTVVDQDLQTTRVQDYPAYHLAAYVAGLASTGVHGRNLPIDLPRLGFIFDDGDVEDLEASGVLVARYHHDSRAFLLGRLEY